MINKIISVRHYLTNLRKCKEFALDNMIINKDDCINIKMELEEMLDMVNKDLELIDTGV